MSRIIGIDYGSKRVGVAVSDDGQSFGFAKTVLPNDELLLDRLAALASDEGANVFVLGESDNPAGGSNTILRRSILFGRALEVRTGLPVKLVKESFSSAEARRALLDKAKKRQVRNDTPVDAAAAAIILQTYLDKQVEGGST